jgi:hypothetical protein
VPGGDADPPNQPLGVGPVEMAKLRLFSEIDQRRAISPRQGFEYAWWPVFRQAFS